MNLNKKYNYTTLERVTQPGGARYYFCPQTGKRLPSVTTIIEKTSDKTGLLEWRQRIGDREADRICREATQLGSLMHTHLECHIGGILRPSGTNLVRQQAEAMADQIIEYGLCKVDEVWGSEISLWYPGLYAGTTDLVGVYDGKPAILDFKSARKVKKLEHIQGYLHQLVGYATSHDELFGTQIETGVIFMVDKDFNYKQFVLEGDDFKTKQDEWFDILDRYYAVVNTSVSSSVISFK